jgi:HD-GYP domain-containing protein (c-di-GMP phosphodiesterase class II)
MARLAELMGTLSLATDAGMGMPAEHGLRAAAVAVRLGEIAGLADRDRSDAYYLALLRYAGCTADSDVAADVMGDEGAVRAALYGVDFGTVSEFLPRVLRAVSAGRGGFGGAAAMVRALTRMHRLMGTAQSHCEVGARMAARFGFGDRFRVAMFQSFERWDGSGIPHHVKGEALEPSMRLAHAAEEIETAHRLGGVDGARAIAKRRARKLLDPRLVEAFEAHAAEVCAVLDVASPWTAALAAEPPAWKTVDDDGFDEALRALGDFADLKSRFTRAHSSGVARLVRRAATEVGMSAEEARTLERAALVHDLGRVAVTAAIWDKPGSLTDLEWERVRTHTYVGERILARAECLASVASVATLAHERLDAAGYHRRLDAASCKAPARLLAASDVYHAMIEDRPQRPARSRDEAAAELSAMARARTLCPDAVAAVLSAAGHAAPRKRRHPCGLTEREVEVLRLVARGLTNKEVAVALGVSTKTAGNHLQNIFEKIGVTTRAAATAFAMQEGLLA